MEYANGVGMDYQADSLEHVDRASGDARDGRGLFGSEFDKLFDAALGENTDYIRVSDDNRTETMEQIQGQTEQGGAVPTAIQWSDGWHKILVTDVNEEHVTFINPWGKEQRMDTEEYKIRLRDAQIP